MSAPCYTMVYWFNWSPSKMLVRFGLLCVSFWMEIRLTRYTGACESELCPLNCPYFDSAIMIYGSTVPVHRTLYNYNRTPVHRTPVPITVMLWCCVLSTNTVLYTKGYRYLVPGTVQYTIQYNTILYSTCILQITQQLKTHHFKKLWKVLQSFVKFWKVLY